MPHRDEASTELKPWERREATNTVAAWWRRILPCTATALSAAVLGSVVFLLFIPTGSAGSFVFIAPIANLVLGVLLLAIFGQRFFAPAMSRIVFYSFTAPTWIFLVWLVVQFVWSLSGSN